MKTNKTFIYGIFAVLIALAVALATVACKHEPEHTHTYGAEWKSNATQHWYECTANDGAKINVAAHTSDRPCAVCGYGFIAEYAIGDTGPGGGIIFYVSAKGFVMTDTGERCHYLEAAPTDFGGYFWASSDYTRYSEGAGFQFNNIVVTKDTAIGAGRKNTALILATDADAPAANACKDYANNGKSDWFLPSKDELEQLYVNRASLGEPNTVGGLTTDEAHMPWSQVRFYWSSSSAGSPEFCYVWGIFPDWGEGANSVTQSYASNIRAIRAFRASGDGDNGGDTHTHSYGAAWKYTEITVEEPPLFGEHWLECGCGATMALGGHDVYFYDPTRTSNCCVTCGAHEHDYYPQWNDTQHWLECVCGDITGPLANHVWDGVGGPCTVCDAPHIHSFRATWRYDAAQHWHACIANDGEREAVAAHTFYPNGHCSVCDYVSGDYIPAYELGDTGPGGGIVFYFSKDGFTMWDTEGTGTETCHYLEAAPAPIGTRKWSNITLSPNVSTGATIGSGRQNTANIIAAEGTGIYTAAGACYNYSNNERSDWFLPSKDELNLLYENGNALGFLNVSAVDPNHWSSTQNDNEPAGYYYLDAWCQFLASISGGPQISIIKSMEYTVHPIRAF